MGFAFVPPFSAWRLKLQVSLSGEFLERLQEIGPTDRVFAAGGDLARPTASEDSLAAVGSEILPNYDRPEGNRYRRLSGEPPGLAVHLPHARIVYVSYWSPKTVRLTYGDT
ncbi:hypothetical protein [Arthrobacter sp. StoSoilB5]|uniref:hypothetical protein n=1 Tax=Arthrobacter sp. StoSoilB5 TaxID=2830992 RepID=UPI001CC59EF0|nr:hypothetical protein [Arthrobacter sp. StoSoilB5]BCW44836.1 hypothetical protein StoSoilB5_20200 [Arthrobacter sp. StoSoilB5]